MSTDESDPVSLGLPNEIWFYVLGMVVQSPDWAEHSFFPPPVDLGLIRGLKNTCKRLRALAEHVEYMMRDRFVSVHDIRDVRELAIPIKDLKHLEIQNDASVVDSSTFASILRPYSNMESLSIIFETNTDVLSSYLSILPLHQSLRRLHLTSVRTDLCHLPLDFPNLVELRLSRVGPRERKSSSTPFMLETPTTFPSLLPWFTVGLQNSLTKLQHLRFLSLHVSVASVQQYMSVQGVHAEMHGTDLCDGSDCSVYRGLQANEAQKTVRKESSISEILAGELPELERVRWLDIWRMQYPDEGCQREYRIVRLDRTVIIALLNFEIDPVTSLDARS